MSTTQPTPAPTPRETPRTNQQCFPAERWRCTSTTANASVFQAVPADFARTLERELSSAQAALAAKDREIGELRESLTAEKNYHGQAQAAAYEQNEIANRLSKELADLKNAGGPPFIRSEAIRNLRDQVCGLKARAEKAEAELAALKERAEQSYTDRSFELLNMTARAQRAEAERAQLRAEVEALKAENRGMLQAGGYDYLCQQRDEAERRAAQYLATGEAIQKQLFAAQEDKERLDWLASIGYVAAHTDRHFEGRTARFGWSKERWDGAGLRAAIDAAREAKP